MRYKLPKLTGEFTSKNHQIAWEAYEESLRVHDQGHKDIALETAEKVIKSIKKLRHKECKELIELANETGFDIVRSSQEEHDYYDQTKRFGVLQGTDLKKQLKAASE